MTVDSSYPENTTSSQIVKQFTTFDKQNERYQQQQQQQQQKMTPDLSMIPAPQLPDQVKMEYQLYKSSPSFLTKSASSTFLSVLLQDVASVTDQRFCPSIMSNSCLSLTCTSTPTASNSPITPQVEEDDGDEEDSIIAVELKNDDDELANNNDKALKSALIKQLQLKVKKQEQEISVLKACLTLANQKLQDVTEKANKASQAKEQTENELEDLSTQLFEQANKMVAHERRLAKEQIETAAREVKSLRNQLGWEKSLRQRISYYENDKDEEQQSIMMIQPTMGVLDLALFRDFIQRVRSISSLEHAHRLPFMKQCLEQDVYPCLQRMKKLSTRKLLNSLVRRRCQVEEITSTSSLLSPLSTHCYACGIRISHCHRETKGQEDGLKETRSDNITTNDVFQFRLNNNDKSWHQIDRPCKDRLLAASNFYDFIRHLHLGLHGQQRSIESLFHEMVWLRLYMFWARSGITFNDDISAKSTLLGILKLFDARSYLFC